MQKYVKDMPVNQEAVSSGQPPIQSLFDIDFRQIYAIKRAFQNQPRGLKIGELLNVIRNVVNFEEDRLKDLEMALDHVHPEYITWKEFENWFQGEGEARDQVHDAMLNQVGMTRIEEDQTIDLSNKRVEPKVEFLLPIKTNLLFIVFENRVAKFFDMEDMRCVHKLQFGVVYKIDLKKPEDSEKEVKKTENFSEGSVILTEEEDRSDKKRNKAVFMNRRPKTRNLNIQLLSTFDNRRPSSKLDIGRKRNSTDPAATINLQMKTNKKMIKPRCQTQMSDYQDGNFFKMRSQNVSRLQSRKSSIEKEGSHKRIGDIDYSYEFLGINPIKDYDFARVGGAEIQSDSEEQETIPIGDDGNFLVNLQSFQPRTANLEVRHGGIPEKCFETLSDKKESGQNYIDALKLINDKINQNEKKCEEIRNGRSPGLLKYSSLRKGQSLPKTKTLTKESIDYQELIDNPDLRSKFDIRNLRSKELQSQIEKVQEQFKPNYQKLVDCIPVKRQIKSKIPGLPIFKVNGSQLSNVLNEHQKDKLEGQLRQIESSYDQSYEKSLTLADLFSQDKKAEIVGQQMHNKMKYAQERTRLIQRVVEGDRKAYIESKINQKIMSKFVSQYKPNLKPKEKEPEFIEIEKRLKNQYAAGGSVGREEYLPKIPQITACHYSDKRSILIVGFISCNVRLFKINGCTRNDGLDIDYLQNFYKAPFVCESIQFGLQKVNNSDILFLAGEGHIHVVNIDTLDAVKKIQLPRMKNTHLDKMNKFDMVSEVIFDETFGIIVTFYAGYFKMFEPIDFKMIWVHEDSITQEIPSPMSISAAGMSKKLGRLAIGGVVGQIKAFDIISRATLIENHDVHSDEIIKIVFYDEQYQMITCSRERQISLWDSNKFECVQTIKDLNFHPNYFNVVGFTGETIIASTFKLKYFKIRISEKIQIQNLQTQVLVQQNEKIMEEKILQEAMRNSNTVEGKIIKNQIINKRLAQHYIKKTHSGIQHKIIQNQIKKVVDTTLDKHMMYHAMMDIKKEQEVFNPLGKYAKKPKNFGKVIFTQSSQLVFVQSNFDYKNFYTNGDTLKFYTVDSDFLVKIWHFHYNKPFTGKCSRTVIIIPSDRNEQVLSEADNFKNELARGDVNNGAIKRKIQSCVIYDHTDNQKNIALTDEQGVVQINNLYSGTVLQNLTTAQNKKEISKIIYVNRGKLIMVAACIDGSLIFYYGSNKSRIKKEHRGDINSLCQNQEFVAAGGYDNVISFWKIVGGTLQAKLQLPGDPNDPQKRLFICDMKFIGSSSSDYKSNRSYLIVLQNNGVFHICHPNSSVLVQKCVIESHCFNGRFSVSQSSEKLNPNGIFVVNERASLAETYIFGNDFGLKRRNVRKKLDKYTTKVIDGDSSLSDSVCTSSHDLSVDEVSIEGIVETQTDIHISKESQNSKWLDKFLAKRKSIYIRKNLPVDVQKQVKLFQKEKKLMEAKIAIQYNPMGEVPKDKLYQFNMQVVKAMNEKKNRLKLQQTKKLKNQNNQEILFNYVLLKKWTPIEPSYEQINTGYPEIGIKNKDSYKKQMLELGTAQLDLLNDAQIIGSGLCMVCMTNGIVKFFNFITGDHIYTLNTHEVYTFPSQNIQDAIDMCARTYYQDLMQNNICAFSDASSHSPSVSMSDT